METCFENRMGGGEYKITKVIMTQKYWKLPTQELKLPIMLKKKKKKKSANRLSTE